MDTFFPPMRLLSYLVSVLSWAEAKSLPYKHAIATYDAAMTAVPSQFAYGSCRKN